MDLLPPPSPDEAMAGPSSQQLAPTRPAGRPPNDPYANSNFPPPPEWYRAFTGEAWRTAKAQRAESGAVVGGPQSSTGPTQAKAKDEASGDVPWEMRPPRVDWIEEDGRWMAFGEEHQLEPRVETLDDAGLGHLLPKDTTLTKKEQLHLLLRSLLHTKLLLLDALGKPPRTADELQAAGLESEGRQYIAHMTDLASAMTIIANELRPVQADMTLELMLQTQLDRRRAQTAKMRERCEELRAQCGELKARAGSMSAAITKDDT